MEETRKRHEKSELKENETKRQKIDEEMEVESDPCKKKKLGYLCLMESMELLRFDPFFQGSALQLSPPLDSVPVDQRLFKNRIMKVADCYSYGVCGSKMYVFGGAFEGEDYDGISQYKGTKDIMVLNFEKSDSPAWSPHHLQMNASRYCPLIAVHGTKIYILASTWKEYPPDPWGEVFDTVLNTITPLKDPPKHICNEYHLSQPVIYKNILYIVPDLGKMAALDLNLGLWYDVSDQCPDFPFFNPGSGSVVTDDGVFYGMRGHFITHDMCRHQSQYVQGLHLIYRRWPLDWAANLLDLGDHKCCLFWITSDLYFPLQNSPMRRTHVLNVVTIDTDIVTFDPDGCCYTPTIIAQAHYPVLDAFSLFSLAL